MRCLQSASLLALMRNVLLHIFILAFLSPPFTLSAQTDFERVLFMSERDGNREIYVMNPDGHDLRRLTNNPAEDIEPTWSPDRQQIAFASNREEEFAIFVMNTDGTNQYRISPDGGSFAGSPSWSPDGRHIAYVSNADGTRQIHVMTIDGIDDRPITDGRHESIDPVWSPDGRAIIFSANPDGNFELFVIRRDGTGVRQITSDSTMDSDSPAWSPDGTQIAFASNNGRLGELYVMDANGSNMRVLVSVDNVAIASPTWSPNGESILYSARGDVSRASLQRIRVDGFGLEQLELGTEVVDFPAWAAPNLITVVSLEGIGGDWQGFLYQGSTVFDYSMSLSDENGDVYGSSRISYFENTSVYGVITLDGTLRDDTFRFSENEVIENERGSWCIKNGTLTLITNVSARQMSGSWEASGCQPGTIDLYAEEPTLSGVNISGEWEGILYQQRGGSRPEYEFSMSITQDGTNVVGTTTLRYLDDRDIHGIMSFEGNFRNGLLRFEEIRIVEENPAPGTYWCVKSGILAFSTSDTINQLFGSWVDPDCASGGRIEVFRSP